MHCERHLGPGTQAAWANIPFSYAKKWGSASGVSPKWVKSNRHRKKKERNTSMEATWTKKQERAKKVNENNGQLRIHGSRLGPKKKNIPGTRVGPYSVTERWP